jgi:hypothetical protein
MALSGEDLPAAVCEVEVEVDAVARAVDDICPVCSLLYCAVLWLVC